MKKRATFFVFGILMCLYGADPLSLRAEKSDSFSFVEGTSISVSNIEAHPALVITEPQDPPILVVNGVKIDVDAPPQVRDKCVLVPVRHVGEALGYGVSWDAADGSVTVFDPSTQIVFASMRVGSSKAAIALGIHGVMDERTLELAAYLVNDRLMVPASFIAEALGCSDRWDSELCVLTITSLHS